MTDVRETLSELVWDDARGAVWCAVLCAMTQQHHVEATEHRPATALRLAALWAQGVCVSTTRLQAAADAANEADEVAARAADTAVYAAGSLLAAAEHFAAKTAQAAEDSSVGLVQLQEIVEHQLATVEPTGGNHPLWDWTLERHPEPVRVGSLGDALARARRWRLRLWVPHERAIAERLTELPSWWANREAPS